MKRLLKLFAVIFAVVFAVSLLAGCLRRKKNG